MKKNSVEAIAYHEAGHVAAHLFYKHPPFKKVSIIPDAQKGSLGQVIPVK